MSNRSPKFLLVEERLGQDLSRVLADRRSDGETYERIARELWSATGVDITSQTVANWCAHLDDEAGVA